MSASPMSRAVPSSKIVGAVKFDDGIVGVVGPAVAEGHLRKGCRSATTAHLPLSCLKSKPWVVDR